jgi:hypothetical protein
MNSGSRVRSLGIVLGFLAVFCAHAGDATAQATRAPVVTRPSYENTYAKDFIMDVPWRVADASTTIPLTIILKDCDTDDVRQLHWIRCWDVTGGGSTTLWDHSFGDERIGDDPTEANAWTYITTVTEGHPSLPNGTLLTPANLGYAAGDVIRLRVSIYYRDDIFNYTETRNLRVRVGDGAFPWPAGWYGGDMHTHTMYTNNVAESGAPIPAQRRAAAAIGLHWLITTDHSCDMDETGDGDWSYATPAWEYTLQTPSGAQTFQRFTANYGTTWDAIGTDVADFQGPDFRMVRGAEVNLGSIDVDSPAKTLHCLFVDNGYVSSPWSGALGERPVFPTVPDGLAQVAGSGFAFSAHPLSDLGAEFGGLDYAVNGALWGDQDQETALLFESYLGLEAFNTRPTRYSTNETDPWADFDAGVSPDRPYPAELLEGIAAWDVLLRAHLVETPGADRFSPARRVFLTGGSDAHGDFNYTTSLALDSYATDNAIGRVQTVARVPGPYGPGNLPPAEAILDAVRLGRMVVTDGPFVEMGIDRDNDGDWYETEDLQLGDQGSANPNASLPMRIRWASLPEFGPITSVRIFAGSTTATSLLLAFDPTLSGEGYLGSSQLDLRDSHLHGPHYFRVECLTSDGDAGHRAYANPIWVDFSTTADVVDGWAPVSVAPPRVAPDPSSGTIRIEFALTKGASVGCTIHDAAGRRVRRLSEGQRFSAGGHKVEWDGRDDRGGAVPSGVYYGVLTLDGVQSVHKLHLIR